MGLLGTTTAKQYYNSSQEFTATASQTEFVLTVASLPALITDFLVFVDGTEVNPSTYAYAGPTGGNAHAANEWIEIDSLTNTVAMYAAIAESYLIDCKKLAAAKQ